ncbi:MAG: retroviral-like aspartic protease family protein [Defluviitaleaceae bacterium]|nr:retroviral-like aspartic protease family protein [Defluviitaleaceae bacterium]
MSEHTGFFDFVDNRMVIDLHSIDSSDRKEPVKFLNLIIDTGAFMTLIRKGTAERNGYPIISERGCIISGFSEKGLVCDLRQIPSVVFCGYSIRDVIIATPHADKVKVSEVLGMNILENFDFGFNLTKQEIYLNKRGPFESIKPRYKSGEVSLFTDSMRQHLQSTHG